MQADIDAYDVLASMDGYARRLSDHVSQLEIGKVQIGYVEAIVTKLQAEVELLKAFATQEPSQKDAA